MSTKRTGISIMLVCALLGAWVLPSQTSLAAPTITHQVNTTADTHDASPGSGGCADSTGKCSLRAAVEESNAVAGADVVNLPAGSYTLGSTLELNGALTINGASQATTLINGAAGLVGLRINSSSQELNDLTVQNFAAAIYLPSTSTGNLQAYDVTLRNNTHADNSNAGSAVRQYCSTCTVGLHHVAIYGNQSPACGAISAKGSFSIDQNSSVSDNHATSTTGGAICVKGGSFSIMNSSVYSNDTTNGDSGFGGAIYQSDGALGLFLVGLWGNSANTGGAIYSNGGSLSLDTVNLESNSVSSNGGALLIGPDLSLAQVTNSNLVGNQAIYGGGIFSYHAALKISSSAIVSNSVSMDGGGLFLQDGLATLVNTTVSNNRANRDGAGVMVKYGGLNLGSVTLARNTADADDNGDGTGGGLFQYSGADPVVLRNTILAENVDLTASQFEIANPDCVAAATLTSQGYNLIGKRLTLTCPFTLATGDMVGDVWQGVSAGIGPLTQFEAMTYHHTLDFLSLAVDRANPAGCKDFANLTLTLDQRGELRPIGRGCDIGAYELQRVRRYLYLALALK